MWGFIAAGVAELGLAAAVLSQPSRVVYAAVVAVTAALIGLYAFNVFFGLPFAGAGESSTHRRDPSTQARASTVMSILAD